MPAPVTWDRFAGWLAELMRGNSLGELVVALDGLDELPAHSDAADLLPPADRLPPGCYLVLTARPDVREAAGKALARVRSAPRAVLELPVGPGSPAYRKVLLRYAARQLGRHRPGIPSLPAGWANTLVDLADSSFLYVFHYCRALRFGVYEDLSQLPPPARYYPEFFEHLKARVGEDLFENAYARTLALLAAWGMLGTAEGTDFKATYSEAPITLTQLTALGLERGRLIFVLDDLAGLLRSHRRAEYPETAYSLGHSTIIDFLEADPSWWDRIKQATVFLASLANRRYSVDWFDIDLQDRLDRNLLSRMIFRADDDLCARLSFDVKLAHACLQHVSSLKSRQHGLDGVLDAADFTIAAIRSLYPLFRAARRLEPDRYNPGEPPGPLEESTVIRDGGMLMFEPGHAELRRLVAVWYTIEAHTARKGDQHDQAMAAWEAAAQTLEPLLSELEEAETNRLRKLMLSEVGETQASRWDEVPLVGALVRTLRSWFGGNPLPQPPALVGPPPIRTDRLVKTATDLAEVFAKLGQCLIEANLPERANDVFWREIDVRKRAAGYDQLWKHGFDPTGPPSPDPLGQMSPELIGKLLKAYFERAKALHAANMLADAMRVLLELRDVLGVVFPGEHGQRLGRIIDNPTDDPHVLDMVLKVLALFKVFAATSESFSLIKSFRDSEGIGS